MNVSELARQLNINPKKMLEILPEFGFDIGARAVKVDDRVAENIKKQWRRIKFIIQERERKALEEQKALEKENRIKTGARISLPQKITVIDFAELLNVPLSKLILELMKNGILATQNDFLDFDTASIMAGEFGYQVEEKGEKIEEDDNNNRSEKLASILKSSGSEKRAPVIVVMGHVDHGKTKLLDAIRETDVVASEHGGITQHIGAYQVQWIDPKSKEQRPITFIDTPGHEAFTVMRSRGAKIADIAILVVAADDSVKPQTVEAINIIKAAKIPYVVAINKVDKEAADVQKTKTDLSQHGVIPEEWGGDIPMIEISAKEKLNIDKLLDTLLLIADINESSFMIDAKRPAAGTVVEAHVDKGQGPVATILIQAGTLNINDPIVLNGEIYGKVRAMKNYRGENLTSAGPSCPAKILGFKAVPRVGDVLDVSDVKDASNINIKEKRTKSTGAEQKKHKPVGSENEDQETKNFNIVVKADVLGSLEAIIGSLEKLKNEEVGVKIVGKGLGNITADDASLAETTDATIFAFNVTATPIAEEMIRDKHIPFEKYAVIYDLINYTKEQLEKLLSMEKIITEMGKFKVTNIFRTEKKTMIVGGKVIEGRIIKELSARIHRGGEVVGLGKINQVQVGKQIVKDAPEGTECGIQYEGRLRLEEGDVLEAYKQEEKSKKLTLDE